jgi:glycosyltransferase involved in cell wall biosynthesis
VGTEQILRHSGDRIPILYLAPWVDIGGSDTATVDWFRFLDRDRFRPSLITTQPSPNRRLFQVAPYAEELWELPQLISGEEMPGFILGFIHTRGVRVLHVMNSRLGFELLPDIASLPRPPRVVVQLHGEEPGQAGYVRFVTTRFENIVDAFSITTGAVNASLDEYGVPFSKRRLIPIGVDAEDEFSPKRARPLEGLDPDAVHVLFPARLTAQKDPLLMVDVAARLRDAGLRFRLHVLGDGDLIGAVAARVGELALQREVVLHGACADVAPWYAACDIVLMTSEFETSPTRVAHEAMAMGLPVVAPDMPQLRELLTPQTSALVSPRTDARAYAEQICALAADPDRRETIARAARERVSSQFSVTRMAADHAKLYEELLARSPAVPVAEGGEAQPEPPATPDGERFSHRPSAGSPLVSVIVVCFNQGRYLDECLGSIDRQSYEPIETIVVDDCSTEPETLAALSSAERAGRIRLVQLPENRGPCHARNRGIELASGRYVLPLDCDDLLLEDSISDLVGQLDAAGDDVGFVYPNLQYFGNRTDYQEMSSYNLHALLGANQCATGCLIDREVFDRGLSYPEDIVLGHEDWDFALTLAEHGIYGEPARSKTLLCRRHGFSRNDLVEVSMPFAEVLAARHPGLYARSSEIKGEWNPAVSIIALDWPEARGELEPAASAQTCADFELLIRSGGTPGSVRRRRRVRFLAVDPAASHAVALAHGLERSRGRYVLAAYGSPAELLADPSLVEKLLRVLGANPRIAAVALAHTDGELPAFRLLDTDSAGRAQFRALCWKATGPSAPPASHPLPGARPLEALARWFGASGRSQWRQLTARQPGGLEEPDRDGSGAALGAPPTGRPSDASFRETPPELPGCPPGVPYRAAQLDSWIAPQVRWLCRHVDHGSGRYVYTNDPIPPPGFAHDRTLGCLRAYPLPGTTSVRVGGEGGLEFGSPHDTLDDPELLGFAERQSLPLLDELRYGRHPATRQPLLMAGADDPLAAVTEHSEPVGYLEPHPLRPRTPHDIEVAYGQMPLLRSVDLGARRHRYGVGQVPPGVPAGELGAIFTDPTGDCDPLWIDEQGRVFAATGLNFNGRPALRDAVRWIADPLRWDRFSPSVPKLRASARRALDAVLILASSRPRARRATEPAGYLLRSPESWTVPLHAAVHPVTGDQLLTTDPSEIPALGYRHAALLGHLVARARATGRLGPIRPPAPWATRFGLVALSAPDAGRA